MAKRKRSDLATDAPSTDQIPSPSLDNGAPSRFPQRRPTTAALNPETNSAIIDGPDATRASPDSSVNDEVLPVPLDDSDDSSVLSDVPESLLPPMNKRQSKGKSAPASQSKTKDKMDFAINAMAMKKAATRPQLPKGGNESRGDPEADYDDEVDPEEIKEALSRPPPINSSYLPLPWKGRLGYACLCTYLRNSNPPVFQSRTTRIAGILEHRHPLKDPTQPEHPVKNRPDKEQPANIRLGQAHIEQLCLANCKDMIKMLRWNDRYNIKFLRLSSEAFPFASHAEYGYKLAPFASEALADVGKVVAELGHRVSTHPGQFTQLGSPRKPVIDASIRDLEYHDEMLSLLRLPEQQNRDAVMVLHMGGIFGDKVATLDRFRDNYKRLSAGIKQRLVLENDDMCWGVHDLLPICQELNIPLVLDFHHHNIIFDATKIHEGTKEIMDLFPAIRETWTRKGITQKMHHSEPTPAAITRKQRRKHNPRPASLPPCPPDMDLMIEAKDKEQAVFELMRTFKLPGFDTFNDMIPHVRKDDNRPIRPVRKKVAARKKAGKKVKEEDDDDVEDEEAPVDGDAEALTIVPEEDIGMGGLEGRVYWPPGMEEWLRPVKRVLQKKDPDSVLAVKKAKGNGEKATAIVKAEKTETGAEGTMKCTTDGVVEVMKSTTKQQVKKVAPVMKKVLAVRKVKAAPKRKTSESSEGLDPEGGLLDMDDEEIEARMAQAEDELPARIKRSAAASKRSKRTRGTTSYKEEDSED